MKMIHMNGTARPYHEKALITFEVMSLKLYILRTFALIEFLVQIYLYMRVGGFLKM